MKKEPRISVGIMDRQTGINGRLNGGFAAQGFGPVSGIFSAKTASGTIVLADGSGREIGRSPSIRFGAGDGSTFALFRVIIGNRFHWERKEDQVFEGDLVLQYREDETIAAINEIPLEDYLKSVISSEMSGTAPSEFLKVHAILSRSWLLAALGRKENNVEKPGPGEEISEGQGEIIRWYDREDHDLYDVCADDHCQRYQGITKIVSPEAEKAVRETRGMVITCEGKICDARYSKACGGLTEDFATAWDATRIPYLVSISDAPVSHHAIRTEDEATRWILSEPEAYCNTKESALLDRILPDFDRETTSFFRWKVEYGREELERILREKSGIDFGTLEEIAPLHRGPSGRISRLKITGSKKTVTVGKELEIRRWLSPSHLFSSAFVVTTEHDRHGNIERFIFHGAGWGHGVGLCQIGAAVMATRGFKANEVLGHYFPGSAIRKAY
ncbi:MAG: SpoIID/LytB domain-containing protein [Syntrophorhabdus aromaticivorans]|uniref:SpoIID/LytB domain-containing protein n=1 Tax=Syntrophorhabdus aromaticivorans TaxID=328301 RepID=A0A971S248_9BACT|nr:SpoIID/LytB domain-containing protein [Syntrophorhabdus aromaticivorans]